MTGQNPPIPPELIAEADQRIAACAEFMTRITATEAATMAENPDDPIAVLALSTALDHHLTQRSALADALALAIRRLAAQEPR